MNQSQEFVSGGQNPVGEPYAPPPQVQGGAAGTSQPLDGQAPQIALPEAPQVSTPAATPPVDWTKDPNYQTFQSRLDKAEAENTKMAKLLEQQNGMIQQWQQSTTETQRRSEQEAFERQYNEEWNRAPTPQAKEDVRAKYRQMALDKREQEVNQRQQLTQVQQAVYEYRERALASGIPFQEVQAVLQQAGQDPRAQLNAMTNLPFEYMARRQQQQQVPQYVQPQQQYVQQPVAPQVQYVQQPAPQQYQQVQPGQQPVQTAANPAGPVRLPAQQVASPGTVTPSQQNLGAMRNEAQRTGDWSRYTAAKDAVMQDWREREANGYFVKQ